MAEFKNKNKSYYAKYHNNVEDYTYRQNDDELIINDLLEFTQKQLRIESQFLSTLAQWTYTEVQNIVATPIYYGQMVGYHTHDFYEMCYVFEDKVYQYICGNIFILRKGDILFMHPDIAHSLYPNPCATATNILISKKCAHELSEKLFSVCKDNPFSYVVNKKSYVILHNESAEFTDAVKNICQFQYKSLPKNPLLNFHLDNIFNHLVSLMLVQQRENNVINIVNGDRSNRKKNIDEIIEFINTNYASVSAEMVCARFHYSRMQLYRLMKKTTGLSFVEYISTKRIEHAKKLLTSTNMSAKRIAESIGLEENYFYRFFYNYTGQTPKEYRVENK